MGGKPLQQTLKIPFAWQLGPACIGRRHRGNTNVDRHIYSLRLSDNKITSIPHHHKPSKSSQQCLNTLYSIPCLAFIRHSWSFSSTTPVTFETRLPFSSVFTTRRWQGKGLQNSTCISFPLNKLTSDCFSSNRTCACVPHLFKYVSTFELQIHSLCSFDSLD
jgi:hypothetical protein